MKMAKTSYSHSALLRPSTVKGMRDYGALQLYRRNYILSIMRSIYALYGFEPLETPAIESRVTLTGKYGDEGEQLMFHILKSGNFLADISLKEADSTYLKPLISDKGLRYDLTIPLMRYVAQNQLFFPFRRYQIQPVWRADRPQRGRFREFLQCDIDIVGSTACLCEAEILKLIYDVFCRLQIRGFCIKINHRALLSAIADVEEDREKIFCTIVDKLEKMGWASVAASLHQAGFGAQTIERLAAFVPCQGTNSQRLQQLHMAIGATERGAKALEILTQITDQAAHLGLPDGLCCIEPTLARGLTYYTGMVMEATVEDSLVGSLGGGGRYDYLGECFGLTGLSGVGFSFGIDRLEDVMEQQQLFSSVVGYTTEVLLANIEAKAEIVLLKLLNQLRSNGFKAEIYPQHVKLQKQLAYAHKKKIPFVIMLGEVADRYTLKEMQTGMQVSYNWPELRCALKESLT